MARSSHARRPRASARSPQGSLAKAARSRASSVSPGGKRAPSARGRKRRATAGSHTTNRMWRLTQVSLETRALLAILAGALLLRILPLGAFSTEYDEGVYWLSLRAMAQGHALYSSIYYAQPPLFLLSIYPVFVLLGQTLIAARFVVAFYSLVGIAALYVIGKGVGGRYVGLIAALVLAVDPLYLQVSRTLDAEAPALALMLLGIALGVEALPRQRDYRRSRGRSRLALVALSGVLLGLATMTKLFAVVGIVPVVLLLAWPGTVKIGAQSFEESSRQGDGLDVRRRGSRRERARSLWDATRAALVDSVVDAWPELTLLVAGFLLACLVVLAPFLGSASALYSQVIGVHLAAAHTLSRGVGYNLALIGGLTGITGEPVALAEPFAVLWLALAAVTLPRWWRSPIALVVVAWVLASLLLLLTQQPLFAHHVALLAPPLALLAALLVYWSAPLATRGRHTRQHATTRLRRALAQPTLLVYAALILLGASLVVNLVNSSLQDQRAITYPASQDVLISLTLATGSVPGEPVVTDDPYLAGLAGRNVPPELIDTSQVRIQTGNLTAKQIERVVTAQGVHAILFASGRFDAVPGLRAWVRQNYTVGQDFGGGRVLYLKQPQGPVFT